MWLDTTVVAVKRAAIGGMQGHLSHSFHSMEVDCCLHGDLTLSSAAFVQVYDGTPFLKDHPGGADSILLVAGTDATEEFNAIHSEKAKKQLLQYAIGRLASSAPPGLFHSWHTLWHTRKPGILCFPCISLAWSAHS
jgi:hypothetical protein